MAAALIGSSSGICARSLQSQSFRVWAHHFWHCLVELEAPAASTVVCCKSYVLTVPQQQMSGSGLTGCRQAALIHWACACQLVTGSTCILTLLLALQCWTPQAHYRHGAVSALTDSAVPFKGLRWFLQTQPICRACAGEAACSSWAHLQGSRLRRQSRWPPPQSTQPAAGPQQ